MQRMILITIVILSAGPGFSLCPAKTMHLGVRLSVCLFVCPSVCLTFGPHHTLQLRQSPFCGLVSGNLSNQANLDVTCMSVHPVNAPHTGTGIDVLVHCTHALSTQLQPMTVSACNYP